MSVWGENSMTEWCTVSYDHDTKSWTVSIDGREYTYPIDSCASEATAARRALRVTYLEKGLHVRVDRIQSHKHHNKELWDIKLFFHVR